MEEGCITWGGGEILEIENNAKKLEKNDTLFVIIYKNFLEAQNTSSDWWKVSVHKVQKQMTSSNERQLDGPECSVTASHVVSPCFVRPSQEK